MMNFVLCLTTLFSLVLVASCYRQDGQRIVGGEPVTAGTYPWFTSPFEGCGGSLIHKDIVLSAAHCFANYEKSNLVDFQDCNSVYTDITQNPYPLDTGDEIQNSIVEYIIHQNFNVDDQLENDIAVLKLETPIESINPIAYNRDDSIPGVGDTVRVIGIGLTSYQGNFSDELLQVDVEAVDQDQCESEWASYGGVISDDMLCAGAEDKDSCQGDSGGPLFVGAGVPIQVGIVSFGIGCAFSSAPPPVYTRVSYFATFIEQAICCLSSDPPETCADTTNCPSDGVRGNCGDTFLLRETEAPTDAPTEAPTGTPTEAPNETEAEAPTESTIDDPDCFSLTTPVWLKDGGMKYMEDVKVNDMVLTSSGEYEMIYSIDHLVEGKGTTMMKLYLENIDEPALELTPSHMVYRSTDINNPVPARMIQAGDFLQTMSGPKKIKKVEKSHNNGGYINILTVDGTIVVGDEGIIASNYADHWGIGADETHNFLHKATRPLKFFCTQISSVACELPAKISSHERRIVYAQLGIKMMNIFGPIIITPAAKFLEYTYFLKCTFWLGLSSFFAFYLGIKFLWVPKRTM